MSLTSLATRENILALMQENNINFFWWKSCDSIPPILVSQSKLLRGDFNEGNFDRILAAVQDEIGAIDTKE